MKQCECVNCVDGLDGHCEGCNVFELVKYFGQLDKEHRDSLMTDISNKAYNSKPKKPFDGFDENDDKKELTW